MILALNIPIEIILIKDDLRTVPITNHDNIDFLVLINTIDDALC